MLPSDIKSQRITNSVLVFKFMSRGNADMEMSQPQPCGMCAMRRGGPTEGALRKKGIWRMLATAMKQELRLEPTIGGRKEHRVGATQISGENWAIFLLTGLVKSNFSR